MELAESMERYYGFKCLDRLNAFRTEAGLFVKAYYENLLGDVGPRHARRNLEHEYMVQRGLYEREI